MADFKTALGKTLVNEGGYANRKSDRGGETYRGISRVYHPQWAGWRIVDGLRSRPDFPACLDSNQELQQLVGAEYMGYWKDRYSQIEDQLLAEKLFDMGVLIGVQTAIRMLQISMTNEIGLVPDGVFGENTLAAVNQSVSSLLPNYKHTLLQHFVNIVSNDPTQSENINGWISRTNS
jgi:lysozyme family protein